MKSGAAPVVCLHGFPESSLMWEPLMEALGREGRHCYAPDLYGFGDSQRLRAGDLRELARALRRMDRLADLDRVVLVVHDWGGFVGLSWACDNPDRSPLW